MDYVAALGIDRARKSLTPAAAAKVRGELGFAQPLMFGKFGRSLLREFSARQYAKAFGPRFPLTVELRETIDWWEIWSPDATPREDALRSPPPAVVYTDAEGPGELQLSSLMGRKRLCFRHTRTPHVGRVPIRRKRAFSSLNSSQSAWLPRWPPRASRIAPLPFAQEIRRRAALLFGALVAPVWGDRCLLFYG